jgi:vacuolar-type H+-ATPase subunit I/STV1
MAKWFRSEPMEYISIIMNEDAARDCLADLGKIGAIQFTDVRGGWSAYSQALNLSRPLTLLSPSFRYS